MLVLTRKAGQEIVIGDNVRIQINKLSGNRVTIGISAPDDVRIIRGELEPMVRSFEANSPERDDNGPQDNGPRDNGPLCAASAWGVDRKVLSYQTPSTR